MVQIDLGRQGKDQSITPGDFAPNSIPGNILQNDSIPSSKLETSTANVSNSFVVLDSLGRLPAVDGSQLTGVIGSGATFVDLETPTGLVDGANAVFYLGYTPVVGSVHLFLNGLLQIPGLGNDFENVGTQITFSDSPAIGSVILASYRK